MAFREKGWEKLTAESYPSLIQFLDRDPSVAEEKLQGIRVGLVRVFQARGSFDPEALAEETIDRFARKCQQDEIAKPCVGDPKPFIFGFANLVFKESIRGRLREQALPERLPAPEPDLEEAETKERASRCLDDCLGTLDEADRGMMLSYHRYEKREKIVHRKEMAEERGWSLNKLRIKACRLRTKLRLCVLECLGQYATE
jgi:DNA-directed RNA polymerase specialized sigma24 family protein